jgi:protein involved in sex pheromone biosynthesis
MIKRISWIPAVISLTLLGGCIPSLTNDTEVVKETEKNDVEKTIIPSMQLSDQYYRTLLPYEQSASRGLIVSNVHSKYDVKEVENGLIRLSQRSFSTDDYFFQEGQTLDTDTLRLWLARSSQDELGLNPPTKKEMTPEQRATQAPIYLSHIVEQNYLVETDDKTVRLGGISIGLALNSIYYYQKEDFGATYEQPIPQDEIKKNGKKMANEIVKRLRAIEGLEKVPITVGLFKQESRNAIVPGSYFAYGTAAEGKGNIAEWTPLNEEYVLIPAPLAADEKYREAANAFAKFKQDVDKYFSNFTSVVGTGFYQDDQIKNLNIDIPVQLYGTAEIIGFTQYMAGLVMQHFPASLQVEVSVTSINGPEALVIKKADDKEPYVHIYN